MPIRLKPNASKVFSDPRREAALFFYVHDRLAGNSGPARINGLRNLDARLLDTLVEPLDAIVTAVMRERLWPSPDNSCNKQLAAAHGAFVGRLRKTFPALCEQELRPEQKDWLTTIPTKEGFGELARALLVTLGPLLSQPEALPPRGRC